LNAPWHTERVVEDALAAVRDRASGALSVGIQTQDHAALEQLAELVDPTDAALAERARARGRLAHASSCREAKSFDCAVKALAGWTAPASDPASQQSYDELRLAVESNLAPEIRSASLDSTTAISSHESVPWSGRWPVAGASRHSPRRLHPAVASLEALLERQTPA
jgi:hypothetical protein